MAELKPGLVGEATLVVEEKHTARHLGSGGVNVLATPIMIALMEEAGRNAVEPLLEPGHLTVGASLDVKHLAPTPMGMKVTARASVVASESGSVTPGPANARMACSVTCASRRISCLRCWMMGSASIAG
jgi:predicted thioesterase